MTPKVLTPAEVAVQRRRYDNGASIDIHGLCDSHEALRAENARLRGLIEGMSHENNCGANFYVGTKRGPDPCSCVKSKVDL